MSNANVTRGATVPENGPQVNPDAASGQHLSQSKKLLTIAIPTESSARGFRAGRRASSIGPCRIRPES